VSFEVDFKIRNARKISRLSLKILLPSMLPEGEGFGKEYVHEGKTTALPIFGLWIYLESVVEAV
jgi:hypothetical protein